MVSAEGFIRSLNVREEMKYRVLIIGGRGRIGRSVALDLAKYTKARLTLTSRGKVPPAENADHPRVKFLQLDLSDRTQLSEAIAQFDLVIHCAGPFLYRDGRVLEACIERGIDYLDVSDSRIFTQNALAYRDRAADAGITAIINSGVFPGISNSMVKQCVELLDSPDRIHLSYAVSGSGGAGVTVMRTTFLGLQHPFEAWIDGKWQAIAPYSDREPVEFPAPYNRVGVYWFDVPETFTLAESFPVNTVITKFGSLPDFYNHLTWSVARWWPASWLQNPSVIEFLSHVSYRMTQLSDRLTGIGVAMRAEVLGYSNGEPTRSYSTFTCEDTAAAAGAGTGSIAQLVLEGTLRKPGVWSVEQALPTEAFEAATRSRNLPIHRYIEPVVSHPQR